MNPPLIYSVVVVMIQKSLFIAFLPSLMFLYLSVILSMEGGVEETTPGQYTLGRNPIGRH